MIPSPPTPLPQGARGDAACRTGLPSPASGRGAGGEGVLLLIPILLPLAFFARYFGGHVVPYGDDILLLNYPLLSLVAHGLHAGYPILWNPYSGGGYPLAPFSALPFYPLTWLLALLPVLPAMSAIYALDLVIGGLGAYALAACLGVRPAARLVPAVAYPFSGFILAHIFAGHFLEVGLMSWFPMALAALHWALAAPARGAALRRGILCGGAGGMLVLANGVSWLIFVGYPIILVALILCLRALRAARVARIALTPVLGRLALALVAAGLVGLLVSAAVLLPLQDLVGETVRGSGPMSFPRLTRTSEPLLGLALALAPGLFGSDATGTYWFPNPDAYFQEIYVYIGLPILALALAGLVAGRRRGLVLLYAALAVLGVALALGAQTPLYAALYHVVPGFDVARTPARWMLVTTLAVAVLAGAGFDALCARRRHSDSRPRLPRRSFDFRLSTFDFPLTPLTPLAALALLLAMGLLGIALAAGLHVDPAQAARQATTIAPSLVRLLVVALATALVILAVPQLPRPAGTGLVLILVLADLWSANAPLVRPLDPVPYYQNAAVTLAHREEGNGRIWSIDREVPLRLGMLDRQTLDVEDFAPLTLSDYWLVTHPGADLSHVDTGMARSDDLNDYQYSARIAALLGVSLVFSRDPLPDKGLVPLGAPRVPYYGLMNGDWSHPGPKPGPAYAYRVTQHLPLATPIYAARAVQQARARDAVLAPGFNPSRVVLLDSAGHASPSNPLLDAWRRSLRPAMARPRTIGPGVAQLGSTENGTILRVTMRKAGFLLLDQVYDKDWTATVDDATGHSRAVTTRRADAVLTALPLPAGTHTVTLVYAPPSYLLGAILSLLGYALVLGAALRCVNYRNLRLPGWAVAGPLTHIIHKPSARRSGAHVDE